MTRLTRREAARTAGTGFLLGAMIGFVTWRLRLGLPAGLAICAIYAAGLGAALAQRKGGPR